MAFNNTTYRNDSPTSRPAMLPSQNEGAGGNPEPLGWRNLSQRPSRSRRGRNLLLVVLSLLLLISLIFAAIRMASVASATDDLISLRIGNQQAATLDLRQGTPISPYLFGTNVFPKNGSSSVDKYSSGFAFNTPLVINGLKDMHVSVLRYPGGDWGEEHVLSYSQLDDFSTLLNQTGSQGMVQAHIGGPVNGVPASLKPNDIVSGAQLAGAWVDYMNNPKGYARQGKTNIPFHRVNFWTVGNEPDLKNRASGQTLTVDQYVQIFIAYSKAMHQNDPSIKVFGPELSQFNGVGVGPTDANGHLWMDDFLKGVGDYEKKNNVTLLDGVSFHAYPFQNASQSPSLLMSSTEQWNYLLPPLRTLIQQDLGRDVPIAVTEINSNPGNDTPSRGQAALWWADTLGTLMAQQVQYVNFFSTQGVERPYPLFTNNGLQETAMGRVMEMFTHLQHNLVPLAIQNSPVSTYATQDNAHQTVSILFINKAYASQIVQFQSLNQAFGVDPWGTQQIHVAGSSMVLVTMHRGQPAATTTYSFVVPNMNDTSAQPLLYTVCGHSKDPLSEIIPC